MRMHKAMRESTKTFEVELPRVVILPRGKVAHVLSSGANIYSLIWGPYLVVAEVVCHQADKLLFDHGEVRWATPSDPTCLKCAKLLDNL